MIETKAGELRDISGRQTPAKLEIKVFDQGERFKRSIKRLGLFWLIALGCVFVPILHFVLVPAFILVGIFVFIKTFKESEIILALSGPCPSCGAALAFSNIKYEGAKEICPSCRQDLKVIVPLKANSGVQ